MVVCATAAAFPDVDALAMWGGDFLYLRHHRGVTHSVLLAPLWAWLIAMLGARVFERTRERPGGWKALYGLALAGVLLHIAGDWITTYGTMLLAPLSDHRFGLGAVFIIDLALSGILVGGLAAAGLFPMRRSPAAGGLRVGRARLDFEAGGRDGGACPCPGARPARRVDRCDAATGLALQLDVGPVRRA
jgi:inner membrane protein